MFAATAAFRSPNWYTILPYRGVQTILTQAGRSGKGRF